MSEKKTFQEWFDDPDIYKFNDILLAMSGSIVVYEFEVDKDTLLPKPDGKFVRQGGDKAIFYDVNFDMLKKIVLGAYNQGLQNLPIDVNSIASILSLFQ